MITHISDLRPGDIIEHVEAPPETVLGVYPGRGEYTTITSGIDTLDTFSFNDTRHGKMYVDVIIHRNGKEVYRGDKFDHVKECMKSCARMKSDTSFLDA